MSSGEVLPRKEFARLVGVHPDTVDRWRRIGLFGVRLPAVLVGNCYRFRLADYYLWQQQVARRKAPPVLPRGRTAKQEREDVEETNRRLRRLGVRLPEDRT